MSPSQNNAIGVIDSGVGGISVLKCIRAHLLHENLIYVADSKFAPYGEKSSEEITHRVLTAFDFLNKQDVKCIVVACNTATAASIQILRERFHFPIIGMEPAVKPASLMSKNKIVGILATSGTLLSAKFSALLEHHSNDIHFITQPCFGLVELVEHGDLGSPALIALLKKYKYMEIEIGAHTDTRASEMYNLRLSNRRAASALEYLVQNGIERKRLRSIGYGESKPLIICPKNDCTDDEHATNRRCTFRILK